MTAKTFAYALRQYRHDAASAAHYPIAIPAETAACYCLAQIASAVGVDGAYDAAIEKLPETFCNGETEHMLQALRRRYPDFTSWLLCVSFEPERLEREMAA